MSVKNFVETLLNTKFTQFNTNINSSHNELNEINTINTKMYVYLDSKIYPNEFGISVRPLQVKVGTNMIHMQQLIDIFDKVPYITVKETRYRTVYRDPMLMTIDLKAKQYDNNTYYDYYIDKLCLRNELIKYNKLYTTAHEIITKYKQQQNGETQSLDSFMEDCKTNECNL